MKYKINWRIFFSFGSHVSVRQAFKLLLVIQSIDILAQFSLSMYYRFFSNYLDGKPLWVYAYGRSLSIYFIIGCSISTYLLWKGIKNTSMKTLKAYLIFRALFLAIAVPIYFVFKHYVLEFKFWQWKRFLFTEMSYWMNWYILGVTLSYYKKLKSPIMIHLQDHCELLKERQSVVNTYSHSHQEDEDQIQSEVTPEIKYDSFQKCLLNPWNVFIDKNILLGQGEFGEVYKGNMTEDNVKKPIAAKLAKVSKNSETLEMLLKEIKMLILAGYHCNIVEFYGVTSDSSNPENLAIISEFCSFGCLENFLKDRRHTFINCIRESAIDICSQKPLVYINLDEYGTHSTADLLRFSMHVARGMEHLTMKKLIHGDISCRNVLVTGNLIAKITDFGIARRIYNYQTYSTLQANSSNLMLPWRWMSIEAIEDLKMSEKSDVWAYGVLLWEIFSLGGFPFENIEWSSEIPNQIRDGLRLQKPKYANEEIYEIMKICWNIDTKSRPTFSYLRLFFEEILLKNNINEVSTEILEKV